MHVETVCTGDELLTGLTADTNSLFFQTQLLERVGEQVCRCTVVGDVAADIEEALRAAASRSDVVLVSGGLGPTTDDLTAECAANVAGVRLVEHPEVRAHLQKRAAERGMVVTPNNLRQARVPEGAEVVLNQQGSAPLIVQRLGKATLFYVPGVPREYRHLVGDRVLPRIEALAAAQGAREFRRLVLLKTVGLPESHLDARVAPLAEKHPMVVWGFRTHLPENHLKILGRGATAEAAQQAADAAAVDARAVLGAHLFAEGDETMAGVVGRRLVERGETLSAAESATGGLVSQLITSESGASRWFLGAAITYAESLKQQWANVAAETLASFSAVSEQTAAEMARGVRAQTGSTWGVSVTGYAGPTGGTEKDPVGTIYVGVSGPGVETVERHRFINDRERVRAQAAFAALDLLRRSLPT